MKMVTIEISGMSGMCTMHVHTTALLRHAYEGEIILYHAI